jgi:hypothetical protein
MKASGGSRDLFSVEPVVAQSATRTTIARGAQATKRAAQKPGGVSSAPIMAAVEEAPTATISSPAPAPSTAKSTESAASVDGGTPAGKAAGGLARGKSQATKGRRKLPSVPGGPSKLLSEMSPQKK